MATPSIVWTNYEHDVTHNCTEEELLPLLAKKDKAGWTCIAGTFSSTQNRWKLIWRRPVR